ncbi:TPA: hypothetical protein LU109_003537 [Enterobacter hormaechei subsp. xiangfangensis]|nr:hypothetical protein [Enterobacter hormaechei subsp. xiangfangensis]
MLIENNDDITGKTRLIPYESRLIIPLCNRYALDITQGNALYRLARILCYAGLMFLAAGQQAGYEDILRETLRLGEEAIDERYSPSPRAERQQAGAPGLYQQTQGELQGAGLESRG